MRHSRGGDGPKSLLSCCIPNLQLDFFPVYFHRANLEVHTDRGDVATCNNTYNQHKNHKMLPENCNAADIIIINNKRNPPEDLHASQ